MNRQRKKVVGVARALACLGVFDTVGALGVPLAAFYRVNRERYEFHNVELSSITEINLHAIAMDEHRAPFEATICCVDVLCSYRRGRLLEKIFQK